MSPRIEPQKARKPLVPIPLLNSKLINTSYTKIPDTKKYRAILVTVQALLLSAALLFASIVFDPQFHDDFSKVFAQPPAISNPASSDAQDSQNAALRSQTARGTYIVELDWQPKSIQVGNDTTFDVRFLDKSGMHLASKRVNYDFTVAASDLSPIKDFYNQTTDNNGIGKPLLVRFEKQGPIEVTIWVNYLNDTVNSESESATFDITVVPEFPFGATVTAVAGGGMLAVLLILSILRFCRQQPNASLHS